MKTIKGPAVFLAQFIDQQPPFNSLDGLCQWAADLGYKGIQIPTWENFLIDLDLAAESQLYCDDLKGKINSYGLEITELSTHLQGQLVAVMGVGTLKISDIETFDASNINRQFGATINTIGKPKTFATANALRNIADDTHIVVYPNGVNEQDISGPPPGVDPNV